MDHFVKVLTNEQREDLQKALQNYEITSTKEKEEALEKLKKYCIEHGINYGLKNSNVENYDQIRKLCIKYNFQLIAVYASSITLKIGDKEIILPPVDLWIEFNDCKKQYPELFLEEITIQSVSDVLLGLSDDMCHKIVTLYQEKRIKDAFNLIMKR